MFVMLILLMTAEGPKGFIYDRTFSDPDKCLETLEQESLKLPVIYGSCFKVPGEQA